MRFDHAVILVADLERGIEDYERLGFTVTRGGRHADGLTHNALIPFADGTYLELLAFTHRTTLPLLRFLKMIGLASSLGRRFMRRAVREGLIDVALWSDRFEEDVAEARGRAIVLDVTEGGRVRPDGTTLAWKAAIPRDPAVPFLITDVTPRALRVPAGDAARHANRARGIRWAPDELVPVLSGRHAVQIEAGLPAPRVLDGRLAHGARLVLVPPGRVGLPRDAAEG